MSLDISRDRDFAPAVKDETGRAPALGQLWSLDGMAVFGAVLAVAMCSTIGVLLYLA